jgi:SAM-dependent methyltransferase
MAPPSDDAIAWYDAHAETLASQYEALPAEQVHAWLNDLLPDTPALVFDVGAGTGRDAAKLAVNGHQVLAIEPSNGMRRQGQRLHQDHRIRWIDDRLPPLAMTLRMGLLSPVWQHLAPADRPRAFRKLVTLLKSGGLLAITLRHGPAEPERRMHEVSLEEIERLARAPGMVVSMPTRLLISQIGVTPIQSTLRAAGMGREARCADGALIWARPQC